MPNFRYLPNLNDLVVVLKRGVGDLSIRGRLVFVISSISLISLAALDVIALYILSSIVQLAQVDISESLSITASAGELFAVAGLFTLRSTLSSIINWVATKQVAKEETRLALTSFEKMMHPTTRFAGSAEIHFQNSIDRGPMALMGMLANVAALVSESATVLVLMGFFIVIQPFTATIAVVYFATVLTAQYQILSSRMRDAGVRRTESTNALYRQLNDAALLRKSIPVRSLNSLTKSLGEKILQLAEARGLAEYLALLPRYLLEVTLAVGLLITGGAVYFVYDSARAMAALVLLAGISFRLLPIVNRIQIILLTLVGQLPTAKLALTEYPTAKQDTETPLDKHDQVVHLEGVSFRYDDSPTLILESVDLKLERGLQYALVGSSGVGKSTLVDIILGILIPSEGVVRRTPNLTTFYVPQDTHLAFTSLTENVALVWNQSEADLTRVKEAISKVGLEELFERLSDSTPIYDQAVSGGQKQRIGMARALYSGAEFLVLDEVTSSLDAASETAVVNSIRRFKGRVTSLIVSHKLSTIRHADRFLLIVDQSVTEFQSITDLKARLTRSVNSPKIEEDHVEAR